MGIINFNQGNVNKTSVDNDFIINHMLNLSGDFVKIYLYVLMCNESHKDITLDDIANKFGIFSSEVIKALSALSNEGLCSLIKNGDDFSLSFDRNMHSNNVNNVVNNAVSNYPYAQVSYNQPLGLDMNPSYGNQVSSMNFSNNEFGDMQTTFLTNNDLMNMAPNYTNNAMAKDSVLSFTNNVNNNTSKVVYDYMNHNNSNMNNVNNDNKESSKYNVEELDFLLGVNPDITELKEFIEKTYGSTFDPSSLQTLVQIVCSDYVSVKSLKTIVSYLYNNNTKITKLTSLLSALESKAIEINERGINSDEDINEYLTNTSATYMNIVRRFGILGRGLVPSEKNMLDKWLYTFKMPIELINEAIDKTVKTTGKASFDYCNKILTNWKEDGIKSLNDLNKQNGITKATFKYNSVNEAKQTNKFNNYTTSNTSSKLNDFEMENLTKMYNKYGNNDKFNN